MNFPEQFSKKAEQLIAKPEFNRIAILLNLYTEETSLEDKISNIKDYIATNLKGQFRGERSISKFFDCMKIYEMHSTFVRNDSGIVDYNTLLPINNKLQHRGLRTMENVLGPDGYRYILKQSEAFRGTTAGMKNNRYSIYNPNIAQAVFTYLGEPCTEHYPSCECLPYFYILSKNFLQENQVCYPINDNTFFHSELIEDENSNITHTQILASITTAIKEHYGERMSEEQCTSLCNKIKLQYATQEVIKKIVKSIDENLGNTSLIITQDEDGNMTDANISPAYDLDLTFLLGEEISNIDYANSNFYRTAQDGTTDLTSLLKDFRKIPGFKEKMEKINNKFQGNYVEQIFQTAYNSSQVKKFQEKDLRDLYGSFLMRQAIYFKDAYQAVFERECDDREI